MNTLDGTILEVRQTSEAEREAQLQEWRDFSSHVGTFTVSRELIKAGWDKLMEFVFPDVLIVRAEANFWSDSIEYTAYSKHFDVVPDGQYPPNYVATIHTTDGEISKVEWKRWGN